MFGNAAKLHITITHINQKLIFFLHLYTELLCKDIFLTLHNKSGKERLGGANRKGEMGNGQRGGGEEGARGEGISQMDIIKCLGGRRLQSFLTLFTRATPVTPDGNKSKAELIKIESALLI